MQASLALRMCARTRSPIVGFFSRAPLSRVGLPHFRIPGNIAARVTLLLRSRPGTELVRCTQWSDSMESLAFGRARGPEMKKWVSGTSGIGGFSICPLLGREGPFAKARLRPEGISRTSRRQ
jgi:hypothetical protein